MRRNQLLDYIDDNLDVVVNPNKAENPDAIISTGVGNTAVVLDEFNLQGDGCIVSRHKFKSPIALVSGDSLTITYTINIE